MIKKIEDKDELQVTVTKCYKKQFNSGVELPNII